MRRKTVAKFAKDMDRVLDANSHKGGWRGCSIEFLKDRLIQETYELVQAVATLDAEHVRKECVDVANFAMMIWDVAAARLKEE